MAVCPSVCIYQHFLHWTDSHQILYQWLYGNLLIHPKFRWNRSNMLAIATMTVQLHDCGHNQLSCVGCVVLHPVQCHVPFHCHDSDGWLCSACIIMCWNDTHTHTRIWHASVYAHSHVWQRFSDVSLHCELNKLCVACHEWHDFRKNYSTWNVCLDGVSKFLRIF